MRSGSARATRFGRPARPPPGQPATSRRAARLYLVYTAVHSGRVTFREAIRLARQLTLATEEP